MKSESRDKAEDVIGWGNKIIEVTGRRRFILILIKNYEDRKQLTKIISFFYTHFL